MPPHSISTLLADYFRLGDRCDKRQLWNTQPGDAETQEAESIWIDDTPAERARAIAEEADCAPGTDWEMRVLCLAAAPLASAHDRNQALQTWMQIQKRVLRQMAQALAYKRALDEADAKAAHEDARAEA